MLYVDVNIAPGRQERVIVYEGDTAEELAQEFCREYGLDGRMEEKLYEMLKGEMESLLTKIDEQSVECED